jgi:hypothetical protein
VTAGTPYAASVAVRPSWAGATVRPQFHGTTSSGYSYTSGSTTVSPTNVCTIARFSQVSPATSTELAVQANYTSEYGSAYPQSGATLDADAAMLTVDGAFQYGDGNSPGWFWNGTPHNLTSTGPAVAP